MLVKGLQKIKNLDSKKRSFIESAGIPLINPLVDLGNYVMLEIGAPMHVFNLAKLALPINVCFPQENHNSVTVIGGDVKDVQPSSLTIQDQSGIQAIAGIIGSEASSCHQTLLA
jgi:phenylalanyl-tRNA synthetase beta chain